MLSPGHPAHGTGREHPPFSENIPTGDFLHSMNKLVSEREDGKRYTFAIHKAILRYTALHGDNPPSNDHVSNTSTICLFLDEERKEIDNLGQRRLYMTDAEICDHIDNMAAALGFSTDEH